MPKQVVDLFTFGKEGSVGTMNKHIECLLYASSGIFGENIIFVVLKIVGKQLQRKSYYYLKTLHDWIATTGVFLFQKVT